jgi:uncharacterized SAM-binding protein YcdF (DUF218 family)
MDETADSRSSEAPSPAPPRRWARLFVWVISLLALLVIAIGVALDRYGQREREQPAQVIIVLGAGVRPNGEPGDSLRARVRHAANLYHRGMAPALLLTGGQGSDEPRAESRVARDLAIAAGVPAKAIFTETSSTSTRENAMYAAAICREQGWTSAILVSDPYHLWRGQRNMRQAGIATIYPSPAVNCQRNRKLPLRIVWTGREALVVIRDMLTGH